MKRYACKIAVTAGVLACAAAALAQIQSPSARPTFEPDGTVHVPAFDLPPSEFISNEALELQKSRGKMAAVPTGGGGRGSAPPDIDAQRRGLEMYLAPQVEGMKKLYPADIVEQKMGGVRVRVITPKGVKIDPRRILINLHGGAFNTCIEACAMLESLPIASAGGFKVITVDYRQAPEHVFPAASEDVATVYRELLRTWKPKQIGIYGCSAGGSLSAAAAAWLPAHGLPQAGAIGIFGAGGVRFGAGDSAYLAGYADGSFPPPRRGEHAPTGGVRNYFQGVSMEDPMVSPALHPAVAAKFPPTLIITGSRAMDMSPAIVTHSKLLDAGVNSNLIVGEAMSHCYIYMPQLPESQSAYRAIVKFFRTNLG